MKFVTLAREEACGGLLAHAIRLPDLFIPKGRKLTPEDIKRLRDAGVDTVQVALPDPEDVAEDIAAARVARALAGAGVIAREARDGPLQSPRRLSRIAAFRPAWRRCIQSCR